MFLRIGVPLMAHDMTRGIKNVIAAACDTVPPSIIWAYHPEERNDHFLIRSMHHGGELSQWLTRIIIPHPDTHATIQFERRGFFEGHIDARIVEGDRVGSYS